MFEFKEGQVLLIRNTAGEIDEVTVYSISPSGEYALTEFEWISKLQVLEDLTEDSPDS